MSDQASPSGRVARAAALVCSLALASVVVVNAQFGCDAPSSTDPQPKQDAPASNSKAEPTPSEPATPALEVQPAAQPEAQPEAAIAEVEPETAPKPETAPEAKAPAEKKEPVFMPASKSAGDFDNLPMRQQLNPAPQRAEPTQQAPQP